MSVHHRRPTLGFLVDSLLDAYQQAIWQSVVEEAAAQDVDLLCFVAERFGEGYRSLAHDVIRPGTVDALVVVSASVGCNLSVDALTDEFRRFGPIPMVSIGMPIPGAVNLLVDGEVGVRQTMDHLVEVHGRRRIGFIRGPANHAEADARYRTYREALERHGLAFAPSRVFQGDFDRNSGIRAIQALLGERAPPFDALVAANDYMAIYAMQELQRRGVRVPEDVAVAGFDDIRDASCTEPLLTTVAQPMAEVGRTAVQRALAVLRGEPTPELTRFAAVFVVRRSCGCLVPSQAEASRPGHRWLPEIAAADADASARGLEALFPEVGLRLGASAWAGDLMAALAALPDRGPTPFLTALDGLLARSFARGMRAAGWHGLVEAALHAAPAAPADALEALRWDAIRLVANRSEQAQAIRRVKAEEQFELLQRMAEMGHSQEVALFDVLRAELPKLGVRSFFLCRYQDQRREEATLAFHLGAVEPAIIERGPGPFPSSQLVPGGLSPSRRHAYTVLPIHSHDRAEHWGFALCELGEMEPVGYEMLRGHIGTSLKVADLLEREREHADRLEATVEQRTRELREAEAQLLDTARQAGMAEVAVGVLHNVGNLFNSVSVCAEQIQAAARTPHLEALGRAAALLAEHAGDLAAFFAGDARAGLLPGYLGTVAEGLKGDLQRVQREAGELLEKTSLLRGTIRALQEYARSSHDHLLREPSDLRSLVETALRIQDANVRRAGARVRRSLLPVPQLMLERGNVVHVLVNLIKNALEAMRSVPEDGRCLTVELRPDHGGAEVRVSDTGEGISGEDLTRIFGYGFTTKPDGHGFGLHACANLMAQMGGSIRVESDGHGRGAAFTLAFPPPRPEAG